MGWNERVRIYQTFIGVSWADTGSVTLVERGYADAALQSIQLLLASCIYRYLGRVISEFLLIARNRKRLHWTIETSICFHGKAARFVWLLSLNCRFSIFPLKHFLIRNDFSKQLIITVCRSLNEHTLIYFINLLTFTIVKLINVDVIFIAL